MQYKAPYLLLKLILEFFPARLATLRYDLGKKRSECYQTTSQLVNQAICILLFCQLYLAILFQ